MKNTTPDMQESGLDQKAPTFRIENVTSITRLYNMGPWDREAKRRSVVLITEEHEQQLKNGAVMRH